MKPRDLLTPLNAGRVAFGVGLLAKPQLLAGAWIGKDGRRGAVSPIARALGIRDAAIGGGTLAAMRSGQPLRPWLVAAFVSDLTDFAATALSRRDIPASSARMIYAVAGTAVAVGAVALASGDDLPDA
ncbi:MAG: hypothetical protein QOC95_1344 [Thermoleophilaceae bacterium]|nr:hypothetical protein [Thermoleophilaceae bacterium]